MLLSHRILSVVIAVCPVVARAQLGPLPGLPAAALGAPNGAAPLDAQGTAGSLKVLGQTLSGRASNVIDVRDYGAACNGTGGVTGDDAPAFNAAIAAAVARAGGGTVVGTVSFYGCQAIIRTPINLTGIRSGAFTLDGTGGLLQGYTNGRPVIDAMHTEAIHLRNISIFGNPGAGNTPNVGLQIGRAYAGDPAGGLDIESVSIFGAFTLSAMYNFGSEVSQFSHLYLNNTLTPAAGAQMSCFALVQDALNHFNLPTLAAGTTTPGNTAFTGQTAPVDTFESFDDDLFTNPQVTTSGGCTPLWLGSTNGHKFVGGYVSNFSGQTPAAPSGVEAVLWNAAGAGQENKALDFDNFHMETNPTDVFYVTGPNAAPVLRSFRFDESYEQAANSIFKLDPAVTSASMTGLQMSVALFLSPTAKTFDNAAKWTVTGAVRYGDPAAAHWNLPASFGGIADVAGTVNAYTGTLTTGSLTATSGSVNGPAVAMGYDAANGAVGVGRTDGTGTPYVGFGGVSGMRIIGDGAQQLSLGSTSTGDVLTLQAKPAGNFAYVNAAAQFTGPVGFNGAGPVARTDISGSCGGNAVCQKMAALLVANGLASGTVTP